MRSVPNDTGIRIGKAAATQQICADGFPKYYFNFLPYNDLHGRDGKTDILTGILHYEHTIDTASFICYTYICYFLCRLHWKVR